MAVVSKLLGFNRAQILNGLGIAEFDGTISTMMRGMETGSMVKDAIGWGAFTGITSAQLAQKRFTGTPSLLGLEEYNRPMETLGKEYVSGLETSMQVPSPRGSIIRLRYSILAQKITFVIDVCV